jgi:hypothetical protein
VFPTAPEALAAARQVQDALELGPIRMRIGLHTGKPLMTEEGYVGADVHRAARIAAAGHGGPNRRVRRGSGIRRRRRAEISELTASRICRRPSGCISSAAISFRR